MTPADLLLDQFDLIAKCEPVFRRASPEDESAPINLAIYRGFPSAQAFTAFTIGLSHFRPPGGSHMELTISMEDSDDIWALAVGVLAHQIRNQRSFQCGDTIDFGCPVSRGSSMSAFVVTHPIHISDAQCAIDIGIRKILLLELVPIYQEERAWLKGDGTLKAMLGDNPRELLMDPMRPSLV